MLSIIRERMQGWIAGAIVVLLIIPFALWGVNEYFGTGGPLVVATVNGEDISQRDYQQTYFFQRNRMREMLGAQYDPSIFDEQIKKQAIDELVNKEILFQNAKEIGYRVAASSVVQTIQSFEAFQDNGQFSNELYARQLQAQGESPAAFEQRIQKAILTQQLQSGIANSALTTTKEIERIWRLQEQKRDIDHLLLEVEKYKQDADASDEAVEKYYQEHKHQFMTAEKVSIEYVELKGADLGKDFTPTEEELAQFFEERQNQFKVPEERRTRHILISVSEDADEATINKAKEKAMEIRQKLADGGDFEKLAEEYSDDPGSSKLGGDIGFFGRDSLDPAYERAMFALQPGEISDPVLSAFGFHIIRLEEIRSEKSKSFDEVKGDLVAEYQQNKADRKFFEASDKLTTLAYEVPTTLTDAAGAVGLELQSTDLFTRSGGVGIAANPKVTAAAFSNEVLVEGYNSQPIEIGENHIVVLRVKDHQEKGQRSLEDAKEDIKKRIIDERARERVKQKGEEIISRLRNGESAEDVANELQLEWVKSGELKRSDRKVDSAIVKQAFKTSRPQDGQVSYDGIDLSNGNYAIIAVNKVIDGDVSNIPDAQKLNLKRTITGLKGESDYTNLLTSVKENARVVVQDDNI
ncbi:SurA N-terminal domain-containing protein [Kaarinaea lacus]